jgi:hypothetical protein
MTSLFAPPLKECDNATYSHRIDDPANYNYCIVPHTGYDALLFAGIAIIATCVLQGKFSALYVLLAGKRILPGRVPERDPSLRWPRAPCLRMSRS